MDSRGTRWPTLALPASTLALMPASKSLVALDVKTGVSSSVRPSWMTFSWRMNRSSSARHCAALHCPMAFSQIEAKASCGVAQDWDSMSSTSSAP